MCWRHGASCRLPTPSLGRFLTAEPPSLAAHCCWPDDYGGKTTGEIKLFPLESLTSKRELKKTDSE